MGMYTELRVSCKLQRDTPVDVMRMLLCLSGSIPEPGEVPDHPFFQCDRWRMVMVGGSAYFPTNSTSSVVKFGGQWHVLSVANLKNYDGEIQKFCDWIRPYVDAEPGTPFAYHRYEDFDESTPVFK